MSLSRDQSLSLLAESFLPLEEELDRLRGEWLPDQLPLTTAMSALGRVLVANVGTAGDEAVERIAEVLETLLSVGDDEVQNAAATGLLEALVCSFEAEQGSAPLLKRLGPQSREYLRAWDEFTGRKTPGLW